MRRLALFFALATILSGLDSRAEAQYRRLCDPAYDNCRTPILELIENEAVGIDVGFWFMEDARYAHALIRKHQQGVPVRVVFDRRAWAQFGYDAARVPIEMMADAGIPIRHKNGDAAIFHFKTFIFAGQNVVEFSGANFSDEAFVYGTPYENYVDELIVFSDDASIVNSFKRRFDDVWTDTSTGSQSFADHANITAPLQRHYPTYAIDPELSFSPWNSFRSRSLSRYGDETTANGGRIDSIMYRVTDRRHSDAMIAAVGRGVPVRLISEQRQYRDPLRLWHSWNIDRMYMAGVQVRHRGHDGLNHEKLTILHGQRMAIVGSSNWTSASDQSQHEHNWFTSRAWVYDWVRDHFDRKWNNSGPSPETALFVPLPPDAPVVKAPGNGASDQPPTVTLRWDAGKWAHKYDVYLGADPSALTKILDDEELGPTEYSGDWVAWTVTGLTAGTTYYWRVVSRTMADMEQAGPVWSFRTAGGEPIAAGEGDIVLWARNAAVRVGWSVVSDGTAAGGARLATPDRGAPKVTAPEPAPSQYFELTFTADAGVPYRLWIRGKAEGNEYSNDSAWVQFSRSVTSSGTPIHRIGTSSGSWVGIEACSGCGLANWGWQDNGYGDGVLGPPIFFETSGEQRIRVQVREDGMSIDQIILSPAMFFGTAPGSPTYDARIYPEQGGTGGGGDDPGDPGTTLPSGWTARDIGGVGAPGSAGYSDGTFTLDGSGADVWGTADEFHFAYRSLTGDGAIVAHVRSVEDADPWVKAGVMMRDGLDPSAAHAFMLVSRDKGLAFQRRAAAAGISTHTSGGSGSAPAWVKLTRSGTTFRAYRSSDGAAWTLVGTQTIGMPATISVGLAVSSHRDGTLATATFTDVDVVSGGDAVDPDDPPLPSGWSSGDVGAAGAAGSATYTDGTFTLRGSGADVWGTADAFRFAYRQMTGDGSIVARVASVENIDAWTKAGVMMRDGLAAGAAHAFMLVSPGRGLAFQRRVSPGEASTHTSGGAGTAPAWVRVTRSGDTFSAYRSSDGVSWTLVGTDTIPMAATISVGVAVSSHRDGSLATATFSDVSTGTDG